jgi:hypothetical protein
MKSFSSMVPTTLEYQQGPLEAPYMSSMSHNNGAKFGCRGKCTFNSKESSSINITSGVGGMNFTTRFMNPLMNILFQKLECCLW